MSKQKDKQAKIQQTSGHIALSQTCGLIQNHAQWIDSGSLSSAGFLPRAYSSRKHLFRWWKLGRYKEKEEEQERFYSKQLVTRSY